MTTGGVEEVYRVTLHRPEGVSVADMDRFIKDALLAECHSQRKDHVMRNVCKHSINVTREHLHHGRKEAIL